MQQIILSEKLTLGFEPLGGKLRLIIFETDEELVCRKETIKKLQQFLSVKQAHIFKGRLQLRKNEDVIEVLVKQNSAGIISSNTFKKVLEAMNN